MQAAAALYDLIPHSGVAGLKAIVEAPKLPFQLPKCTLDDDPGFAAVLVELALVVVARVAEPNDEPFPQAVRSVAVDEEAELTEPAHCAGVERAVA